MTAITAERCSTTTVPMNGLDGRHVFLSASFPSGERGDAVKPYDPYAVADAVTALVRAVLARGGRLLFGGHPTITPLALAIAMKHRSERSVDIFQSEWFRGQITPETQMLEDLGYGKIHWTSKRGDRDRALRTMRQRMLDFGDIAGAVFVGGMDGIEEEHRLVGQMLQGVPRIPVRGPGGAAARLRTTDAEVPEHLARQLASRAYPFISAKIVDYLCGADGDKRDVPSAQRIAPPPMASR